MSSTILWISLAKLRGGSFSRLADADLRRTEVIFAVFLTRAALYSGLLKVPAVIAGIIHTSVFLVLDWALYKNLHVQGMGLALVGTLMNTVVIAANGGHMPVSAPALVNAGLWGSTGAALSKGTVLTHVLRTEGTRLWMLGDVLWLRWPWGSGVVYSVGDLVLILGMYFAINQLMGVGVRRAGALERARPS